MSTSSPPSRRNSLPLRARLATTVGGAAGRASRLAGRGDRSVIGGVIATADDPLVAWAAGQARQVTWVAAGQRWHDDSWCCPNCGSHLRRDGEDWYCGECPNRRPPVRWALAGDQVIDPAGRARPLDLALPGRANRSNAVVA